jgi:hypothetical protein
VSRIPPASSLPIAAMTSSIFPVRRSSSICTVYSEFLQRMKTVLVAQKNETRPPSAFELVFARAATAPLMPAPAKLVK